MSDQPKTVAMDLPLLTAHILRRLYDSPGELSCAISKEPDPEKADIGEEGDLVVASIPLITEDDSAFRGAELSGNEFFGSLYLGDPEIGEMRHWNVVEYLILAAFDKGREFERSQKDRGEGERDDERVR